MEFSTVTCSKDRRNQLVSVLIVVFKKKFSKGDSLNELKGKVALQVFCSTEVQENYETYGLCEHI